MNVVLSPSPNAYVEILIPNKVVLAGTPLGDGALMNDTDALIRDLKEFSYSFYYVKTQ